MGKDQAYELLGKAKKGGPPKTLPGTRLGDGCTIQRLNIDRDMIEGVRKLGPAMDHLVRALEQRKEDAWDGPVLVKTPKGVGLVVVIGHITRKVMAAHGNVRVGVDDGVISMMVATGALVNRFSPPAAEWASPLSFPEVLKVVQDAAFGSGSESWGRG
jgi:hypothetical protein